MNPYQVSHLTSTLALKDYIADYRDPQRFFECCRQCSAFGRSWVCPPFDYEPSLILDRFSHITIILSKITPDTPSLPISEAHSYIKDVLIPLRKALIDAEQVCDGYALINIGLCDFCAPLECTKTQGLPCRHPYAVRPSLESWGFNLDKTASIIFNTPMLWSNDGTIPRYLTLLSAILHNHPLSLSL